MANLIRVEMQDGLSFEYEMNETLDNTHKAAQEILISGWDKLLGDQDEYYPPSRIRRVLINPPHDE